MGGLNVIFSVGLTVIVVGWSFQTYRTLVKRDQRLNPIFLILYRAGSAVLAYGSFLNADMTAGILNTVLPNIGRKYRHRSSTTKKHLTANTKP